MKIACVSTSQVPSSTANSIQLMKVCHALAACSATQAILPLPSIPGSELPGIRGR